jgi:hypothetical protein
MHSQDKAGRINPNPVNFVSFWWLLKGLHLQLLAAKTNTETRLKVHIFKTAPKVGNTVGKYFQPKKKGPRIYS